MPNPRRPGLEWHDPNKVDPGQQSVLEGLRRLKESAVTSQQLAAIEATIEQLEAAEKREAPKEPLPPAVADLPEGIQQQFDGAFFCEPCNKVIKSASGLANHLPSAPHQSNLAAFKELKTEAAGVGAEG